MPYAKRAKAYKKIHGTKLTLNELYISRCCPEVKKIYLLVRPKKGKQPNERLEDIFSNAVSKYFFFNHKNMFM